MNVDGMTVHLAQRDVGFAAVSRAPLADIERFRARIYSTFGHGVEVMMGAHRLMDLTPKGRDERDVPCKMERVRHHDLYAPAPEAKAAPSGHPCCHS